MLISDIKSGDLLYWKGEGFWPWLIRFWTRPKFWSLKPAPFFHVGVAWWNGVSLFITDASREGVRCIPFHRDAPSHCQHTHSAWCDATTRLMREMIRDNNVFYWAARILLDAATLRKRAHIERMISNPEEKDDGSDNVVTLQSRNGRALS